MGRRADDDTQRADVAAVRARIERWRETRQPGKAMPDELWAAAVLLAGEHGLYAVARALRVDYGALKGHAAQAEADGVREPQVVREPSAVADFVEVDAGQVVVGDVHPTVRELELTAPDGAGLVVRLAQGSTVDVQGLAAALWSRCA